MVGRPTLVTGPTVEPLDLTLVKEMLRIDTGDTSQDNYYTGLIATAREVAESRTSRGYITQAWREYYDHFPGMHYPYPYVIGFESAIFENNRRRHRHYHYFELSKSPLEPVQTVTQIQYKDPDGETQTLDPSQYVVNAEQDECPTQITRPKGVEWPRPLCEMNCIWIDYSVGYSDDGSNIPNVVTQAMLMLISHWDSNRLPIQQGSMVEIPYAIEDLLLKNKVYYQP